MIICEQGSTGEVCFPPAQVEPKSGQALFLSTLEQRKAPGNVETHLSPELPETPHPDAPVRTARLTCRGARKARLSKKHDFIGSKKLKLNTRQIQRNKLQTTVERSDFYQHKNNRNVPRLHLKPNSNFNLICGPSCFRVGIRFTQWSKTSELSVQTRLWRWRVLGGTEMSCRQQKAKQQQLGVK